MELYIYHNDQQSGPFPLEAVREMVRLGSLPETALVWHQGAPDWVELGPFLAAHAPVRAAAPRTQARPPPGRDSFFARVPGAFAYPFKKNGVILLIGGTVLFGLLGFATRFAFLFSVMLMVFSGGYLFAYMQNIIVTSAQGDETMPPWPEFTEWYQDIVLPFCRYFATLLLCLGPGYYLLFKALRPYDLDEDQAGSLVGGIAVLLAGGFYFPMGLLGVAMADGLSGLNPMVIIPSILRVPLQYVIACLLLGMLVIAELVGETVLEKLLPIPLVTSLAIQFVSLYLLTVEMRLLGLLYYTNRDRLRWV